jgi:hypothetical protein
MDNEESHGGYFETQALCTMLSVYGEVKAPVALLRQYIGKSANECHVGFRVVLCLVICMEVEQSPSPQLWSSPRKLRTLFNLSFRLSWLSHYIQSFG